jgi:hypothetical protein
MAKNSDPPHRPQHVLDSLRNLTQSPLWQQLQETLAKLHERMPQYAPEQLERLRTKLGIPQFPGGMSPELAKTLHEQHEWLLRLEQTLEQQTTEQLSKQTISGQVTEKRVAETPAPPAAPPIKRMVPKDWRDSWVKTHAQCKGESVTTYAKRMYEAMQIAPDITKPWALTTCLRSFYRRPEETDFAPEPGSVQTFPKRS